jgi:hypothetical protein
MLVEHAERLRSCPRIQFVQTVQDRKDPAAGNQFPDHGGTVGIAIVTSRWPA